MTDDISKGRFDYTPTSDPAIGISMSNVYLLGRIACINKSVLSLVPRFSTWRCPQPQLRRLKISIDSWYGASAAVDRYLLHARAGAQQQTSGTSLLLSIDGTDGLTNGLRTPDRYTDPVPFKLCRTYTWQMVAYKQVYTNADAGGKYRNFLCKM